MNRNRIQQERTAISFVGKREREREESVASHHRQCEKLFASFQICVCAGWSSDVHFVLSQFTTVDIFVRVKRQSKNSLIENIKKNPRRQWLQSKAGVKNYNLSNGFFFFPFHFGKKEIFFFVFTDSMNNEQMNAHITSIMRHYYYRRKNSMKYMEIHEHAKGNSKLFERQNICCAAARPPISIIDINFSTFHRNFCAIWWNTSKDIKIIYFSHSLCRPLRYVDGHCQK